MTNKTHALFRKELQARRIPFEYDAPSDTYKVTNATKTLEVALDNLTREFEQTKDSACIARFVDVIVAVDANAQDDDSISPERLYLSLCPNDMDPPPTCRLTLSKRLSSALIQDRPNRQSYTWVTPDHLQHLRITTDQAYARASSNMAALLSETPVETMHAKRVKLVMLANSTHHKASLILAPNLLELLEPHIGTSVLAVDPTRDFVYLFNAQHQDFIGNLGEVVVREYSQSPYPLSTEVFHISDRGIKAIGAFTD
jgi:uncharacterized protein YtpQ (UPF0354 family)